jgi:hypothetical protein
LVPKAEFVSIVTVCVAAELKSVTDPATGGPGGDQFVGVLNSPPAVGCHTNCPQANRVLLSKIAYPIAQNKGVAFISSPFEESARSTNASYQENHNDSLAA